MSVEALEDQDLKHLALGLSVFPPEKKRVPLGAVQRLGGFENRSKIGRV